MQNVLHGERRVLRSSGQVQGGPWRQENPVGIRTGEGWAMDTGESCSHQDGCRMGRGDRRSLRLSGQVQDGLWRQESPVVIRTGSLCSRVANESCISNKAEGRLVDLPLRVLWLEAAMFPHRLTFST